MMQTLPGFGSNGDALSCRKSLRKTPRHLQLLKKRQAQIASLLTSDEVDLNVKVRCHPDRVVGIVARDCRSDAEFWLTGRLAWALAQLISGDDDGVVRESYPGVPLASYMRELRRQGVEIETVTVRHIGRFPRTECRYVLRMLLSVYAAVENWDEC